MSSAAQDGALTAISFQQQQQHMDAAINKDGGHFWTSAGPGDPDDLFDQFIILDATATAESSSTGDEDALFSQLMTDETSSPQPPRPPLPQGDKREGEDEDVQIVAATTIDGDKERARAAAGRQGNLEPSPLPLRPPPLVLGATNDEVGSIPDSQLLRFEELSMCSPRRPPPLPRAVAGVIPSSPTLLPLGARRQSSSSAKRPGKLESLYSTIRRATTSVRRPSRPALQQQPETIAPAQTIRTSEGGGGRMGVMTAEMAFVAGYVDDPFVDFSGDGSVLDGIPTTGLPPLAESSKDVNHSPPGNNNNNNNNGARCASMYSSASWPTPAGPWSTSTTSTAPPSVLGNSPVAAAPLSTAYLASDNWWDAPSGGGGGGGGSGSIMDAAVALNMAMHLQQSEMAYEYVPPVPSTALQGSSSAAIELATAGLMIHMPQPRGPSLTHASLLMSPQPPPPPPAFHAGTTPRRRPKPRAPSSGARHHHAAPSPRKRTASISSGSTTTTPYIFSPTTKQQQQQQRQHPVMPRARSRSRSTSAEAAASTSALRKRRSWTAGSSSNSGAYAATTPQRSTSGPTGGGGRGRSSSGGVRAVGFVNYTPSDHDLLMTGVAPSGSSKTKARREKEAAERQRRMNEAFAKVVEAAGGDVGKLKEEGIVI